MQLYKEALTALTKLNLQDTLLNLKGKMQNRVHAVVFRSKRELTHNLYAGMDTSGRKPNDY